MLLTIPDYAKKIGYSRQWVHRLISTGRHDQLKGIEKVDTVLTENNRITYILTFNPDLL